MVSSFPLISFLITLLSAAALSTHGQQQVKDSNGNPIQVGEQYFIQPVNTNNNGGGLVPAAINILPFCPLGITQTLLPYQPGLPVSFQYRDSTTNDIIDTSSDVTIEFRSNIWPVCNDLSKLWEVDNESSSAKERAILIGGKRGDPNSSFKIEKAGEGNTYKLTALTGIVGTIPGPWLSAPQVVLTNDDSKTLLVKFKKVDDATSTSRIEKLGLRMFPFY